MSPNNCRDVVRRDVLPSVDRLVNACSGDLISCLKGSLWHSSFPVPVSCTADLRNQRIITTQSLKSLPGNSGRKSTHSAIHSSSPLLLIIIRTTAGHTRLQPIESRLDEQNETRKPYRNCSYGENLSHWKKLHAFQRISPMPSVTALVMAPKSPSSEGRESRAMATIKR